MAVMLVAIGQGLMAVISPSKKAVKMGSSVCSSRFCKNSMLVAFERCLKRCDGLDKLVLQSVGMRAGIHKGIIGQVLSLIALDNQEGLTVDLVLFNQGMVFFFFTIDGKEPDCVAVFFCEGCLGDLLNSVAGGAASGGMKVVHFNGAFFVGSDLHARFAGFIGFGCCRVATLGGDGYKGHKQEAGKEGDFLFHGFRLLWQICAADGFV